MAGFAAKFDSYPLGEVEAGSLKATDGHAVVDKPAPKVTGSRIVPMGGGSLHIRFQTKQYKEDWKVALQWWVALPGNMARTLKSLAFTVPEGTVTITSMAYVSCSLAWLGPNGEFTCDWDFVVSDQTRAAV